MAWARVMDWNMKAQSESLFFGSRPHDNLRSTDTALRNMEAQTMDAGESKE